MNDLFAKELARFGPDREYSPTLAQARRYCRRLAHSHYENFSVASLLLPRRLLPHFHAVYAYCRWADDLADEPENSNESLRLLDWWQQELQDCYRGQCRHPVFLVLRETIQRFHIPPEPFLDLLVAFRQDQRIHRYHDYAQLLDYCRYSANPVGRLVLYLCESYSPERAVWSDAICTGLQLANFWQDVARDWQIGRVYLPEEDRRRFGYTDQDLADHICNEAFVRLLRFEIDRTRQLFEQGYPLVAAMPGDVQADIELFVLGGLGILRKIEECGYNVWRQRPVLSKWEKMALVAKVGLHKVCMLW